MPNTDKNIDAEKLWEIAWTYINTVVDTVREPFLILDTELKVLAANHAFYATFKVAQEDTVGKVVYRLGEGQWDIPQLRSLLEEIVPENTFFKDFKVEHDFPTIGRRVMLLNARQVFTTDQKQKIILLAMEDITKQMDLEEKLRNYAKELAREVAKRTDELDQRVKELEKLNKLMVGRELKMVDLKEEVETLKHPKE